MKDDFRWIAAADMKSPADLRRIFATNIGFYRPLVTTSFAMDRVLWALDARGYAFTNLALLLGATTLLMLLARQLGLPGSSAVFAAAVWLFNFHGINMALLWLSGRTALLLCVFALGATLAMLRGHRVVAGVLALGAMFCKEEAVVLPPLLVAVDVMWHRERPGASQLFRRSSALWIGLGLYALLRERSGAFGFLDAPPYYQPTLDWHQLGSNALQYLERAAAVALAAAAFAWLAAPRAATMTAAERATARFGVLWFVAMFAITIFLPVRSSLYAVAPSIGSALIAAACASRAGRLSPTGLARAAAALLVVAALLIPVYRSRNHGLVEPQDLAMQSLATLRQATAGRTDVHQIVLIDDPTAPVTLDAAFGALLPDAVHLFVDPRMRASMGEGPAGTSGSDGKGVLTFVLRSGRLVQERTNARPADTSASHSG